MLRVAIGRNAWIVLVGRRCSRRTAGRPFRHPLLPAHSGENFSSSVAPGAQRGELFVIRCSRRAAGRTFRHPLLPARGARFTPSQRRKVQTRSSRRARIRRTPLWACLRVCGCGPPFVRPLRAGAVGARGVWLATVAAAEGREGAQGRGADQPRGGGAAVAKIFSPPSPIATAIGSGATGSDCSLAPGVPGATRRRSGESVRSRPGAGARRWSRGGPPPAYTSAATRARGAWSS